MPHQVWADGFVFGKEAMEIRDQVPHNWVVLQRFNGDWFISKVLYLGVARESW
jgi:hypothetical protein